MPTNKDRSSRTGLSFSVCEGQLESAQGREKYASDYQTYASELAGANTDPVGYCLIDLDKAEGMPLRNVPDLTDGPCGEHHALLQADYEDNCPTRAEAEILQANANMANMMLLPGDEHEGPHFDPKAKKPK